MDKGMPEEFLIAFLVFLGFVIAGRFILESGLKQLDTAQKAALVDSHAGMRKYNLIAVAGIVLSVFYFPAQALWIIVAYILIALALSFRNIRRFKLPRTYLRAYALYVGCYLGGVTLFLTQLQWGWMGAFI